MYRMSISEIASQHVGAQCFGTRSLHDYCIHNRKATVELDPS